MSDGPSPERVNAVKGPVNPEKMTRQTAMGLQTTNMVFCPGLGNYWGGAKTEGSIQIAIYLVGFSLSLLGLAMIVHKFRTEYAETGSILLGLDLVGVADTAFLIALSGVLIFAASWIWALRTGSRIIREATAREKAGEVVPAKEGSA